MTHDIYSDDYINPSALFNSQYPEEQAKNVFAFFHTANENDFSFFKMKKEPESLYQPQSQTPPKQEQCVLQFLATRGDITFDKTGFPPS